MLSEAFISDSTNVSADSSGRCSATSRHTAKSYLLSRTSGSRKSCDIKGITGSATYSPSIPNTSQPCFSKTLPHTFEAKVYAREPKIDPQTRSIKVRAIALNAEQRLIPGAFAKLTINLGTIPEAIEVPSEAIIPAITGQTLYVVRAGTAKVQPIKTGIRTATTTQITEGIVPGDTIITTGLLTVRPGAAVKPIIVENKKD